MSLISLGTVAIDSIKTASGSRPNLLGGSAAHFSMSARLFTDVHLVSTIGKDFPRKHIRFLQGKKVNTSSILEEEGKTFRWQGEFKKGDYNHAITKGTELGVLLTYSPRIAKAQRKISNVFLANFDPDIQLEFLKLMHNPKFVALDTMNLWIAGKKKSLTRLMKHVDLFVANDGEASALAQETNLVKAAKALRKMGPKFVVIKKGEHGMFFYSDRFQFSFPAYPVEHVVDPTGAGDTFAGGLVGYLSKTQKLTEANFRRAAIYGTTLASFNVEGFGMSKTAPLTLAQVNKRLNVFKKYIQSA